MVESPVPVKQRHPKRKPWTRRQRNKARILTRVEAREQREQERYEARALRKKYAAFAGCDPERTEAIAEFETFLRRFDR